MTVVPFLLAAGAGYLLGSLPFGYLVARRHGVNIFEVGSKNPGATNVRRVLGPKPGNLVFALDALKGALATGWPLGLAALLSAGSARADGSQTLLFGALPVLQRGWELETAIAGLIGALLGHSFSLFTRFRGGKGVATTAGGLAVLMPVVLGLALALWLILFYSTRYVSLASILAALSLPISAWLLGQPPALLALCVLIALFVAVRHRANVRRLLAGTESKFVKKQT